MSKKPNRKKHAVKRTRAPGVAVTTVEQPRTPETSDITRGELSFEQMMNELEAIVSEVRARQTEESAA
ncbi:hypothetical protein F9C28_10495 [Shimwellia pseudoproteus]|uniref:hypothetical protein n=1 Tax=Shimwellia pseudoproteus TaxID=570012 RepID=UPI0018EDDA6F|nr:hypothetical protein [Shimwellia pseudoproteus]MBJ3815340.1 hypothetical protein [Shimwellia pseudoproteus]